jgi:hypothetical protein
MTDIVNNRAQHRYKFTVDGHIAATYYELAGDVITIVHTEVPRTRRQGHRLEIDQGRARPGAGRWVEGDRAVSICEGIYRKAP